MYVFKKAVSIIENKVKLCNFVSFKDDKGMKLKNYLSLYYISKYLDNADYIYALLYSRGYIRISNSVQVESAYITNLTEADKHFTWRKKPKPEKYIRYYHYTFDDGTNCVVFKTNNKKLTPEKLIKRFKVDFDCIVVYLGENPNYWTFYDGIYRYINRNLIAIEILKFNPFAGF